MNGYVIRQRHEIDRSFHNEVVLAHAEAERIPAQVVVPTTQRLPTGQNFADALERFGLTDEEAAGATSAAQHAFNLRQLRAGNTIVVGRSVVGELREINSGMNGDLKICPKAGYVIAVLANMDPPAAQRASGFAAARLPLEQAHLRQNVSARRSSSSITDSGRLTSLCLP